jgi:hypothetical protein
MEILIIRLIHLGRRIRMTDFRLLPVWHVMLNLFSASADSPRENSISSNTKGSLNLSANLWQGLGIVMEFSLW